MKRISRNLCLSLAAVLLFYILAGWKIPVVWRIEALRLPEGCTTVHRTKVWISDVYWLHTKGEKVIKCDMGYEAARAYIEEHNSGYRRKHIEIYPYEGMSDIAIYDSQYDETFLRQPDRDQYITISYFRKW